jgi:hypothetical protein
MSAGRVPRCAAAPRLDSENRSVYDQGETDRFPELAGHDRDPLGLSSGHSVLLWPSEPKE